MLLAEILLEMRIRSRATEPDWIVAFQDNIWLVDDATPPAVLQDIKQLTGLRGATIEDMRMDAKDHRPDVLSGYLYDNKLAIDGVVSITLNPRSSLLIKKVVQQLGLDGVLADRLDTDSEDYQEEFAPHDLIGQIPEVVFHGTSSAYINRILRIGLAPTENSNWAIVGKFSDKIFLTASFNDASFHANNTSKSRGVPIVVATRIPDRSKITLDYDVGATMHGVTPSMDREGYTASLRPDEWDKSRVERIAKYDRGTNYTREIGIFGYRGRIPSSFFSSIYVADGEGPLTDENAVQITNRTEMLKAIEMIEDLGSYDPSYQPEEDEEND